MRDEYNRGEFEARNRQLPADLDQSVAYNASAKARADFEQTPVGTPPICYDVRSVFDARPINTYDFRITQSDSFTFGEVVLLEMTVPEGYMAVLRGIEYWMQGAAIAPLRSDVLMNVTLNGGDYPNNVNIPVGWATDGPMPFFLLADEFNRIGARFTYENDIETFYVIFTGNFILKSGRPYPFEIANPAPNAGCATAPRLPSAPAALTRAPLAPTLSVPATLPTRAASALTPPFLVDWAATRDQRLVPFDASAFKATGKKRYLTVNELRAFSSWLRAQLRGAKEREFFENHLRSVGVS